jgi:hypothetical protein
LQARDKGKKVFRSKDFYDGITPIRNNQDSEKKTKPTFFADANRSDCKDNKGDHTSQKEKSSKRSEKSSQQKEKKKHDGWGYDREFTPLDQPLEEILEYMLVKEMVKLPKIANPPIAKGKWKDRFCKFHQTVGHDIEHCFVFKNIVQDYTDKNFFVGDKKVYPSTVSSKSQQQSSIRQEVQHDDRNQDNKMAPLDQIFDSFLEYMRAKDMVRPPKTHFTLSANNNKGNKKNCNNEGSKGQKGKFSNNNKPLQSSPQHKEKDQEKPKRKDWSTDRKFTPLDQTLESVLEYMLAKDMIRLPKAADPTTIMGRFREKLCKFHRAVGHDTENCFVLKNIIQDCINKNILIEDEEDTSQPS